MSKGMKEGSGVNKRYEINDTNVRCDEFASCKDDDTHVNDNAIVGCDESDDNDKSSVRHVRRDHTGSGGGLPVSQFGEFVSQQHAHRNKKFKDCFKVLIIIYNYVDLY